MVLQKVMLHYSKKVYFEVW